MTFLSALQSAAIRLIGRKPISMFSGGTSNDRKTIDQLVDLANDVAKDIAESHDWQALTKVHTITGDGVATTFPLPSDYQRMLLDADLIDPDTWFWGYHRIPSISDWMYQEARGWQLTPGGWIILEDAFNFVPAPGTAQTALFPYITRNIVKPASGDNKAEFTSDTDTFVLRERLLTLGLIWRWKEQNGLEYAEDMQTYEIALSQAQARDGGSRIIRDSRSRLKGDFRLAWPWELGT